MHDWLQCLFFIVLGTLITSGGELHSDDELGRLGNRLCNDALLPALKPMYIKGQLTQMLRSLGIKLPSHVVTACTSSFNAKVKLFKSMFTDKKQTFRLTIQSGPGYGGRLHPNLSIL